MQQCPECDRFYDESEYAKCPFCHPDGMRPKFQSGKKAMELLQKKANKKR